MMSQKAAGGFLLMFTMLIATLYTLYYENQIVLSFQRLQAQYHITRFQNPFSKEYINEKIGPNHHYSSNKAHIHRENSNLFLPPNERFQELEQQIKQYLSNSTKNVSTKILFF